MSQGSAIRFGAGTSMRSTRSLTQPNPPPTSRGSGKGKTGGMPGYIKTAQDKSSGGLANPSKARGKQNAGPRREGYIPTRAGESRKNWESSDSVRGSSDRSYRATSTAAPGAIRRMGEPKAPAKRPTSEREGPSRGESGRKGSVMGGGEPSANRLPPGGIGQGRAGGHATIRGGQGSAKASGQSARARGGFQTDGRMASVAGNKAPPTAKGFIGGGGKGTMESLRGRVNTSDNFGMGKQRGRSQMY
jgi:hypothetical protein